MSDDLDLIERFEPLAAASFAPATGTDVLRTRVARRRRHRALIATGSVAGILLVAAVAAALVEPRSSVDDVHAGPPTTESTTPPAAMPIGSEPRLVLAAIPPELASDGCSMGEPDGQHDWVVCTLGIPATPVPDGLSIGWARGPASADLRAAWDRRDGEAVAQATGGLHGPVRFTDVGGKTVLALGETGRIDGSSLGQPDRTSETYEVLVGSSMVQINAEGVTEDQLAQVIGGMSLEPSSAGFTIPEGALPAGAQPIAQGQERLWFQPDATDPSRSVDNGGEATGITFSVDGARIPLSVTVVRGVDAGAYVETWAGQQAARNPASRSTVDRIRVGDRQGRQVRLRTDGAANGPLSTRRLAVIADEATVVIVQGPTAIDTALDEIAATTVVGPTGESGVTTTAVADQGTEPPPPDRSTTTGASPPAAGEAGWYAPADLPDGWQFERAAINADEDPAAVELWLLSPTGNQFVVTVAPRTDEPWHAADAEPHNIPGQAQPVYFERDRADLPQQSLLTARGPSVIIADWLGVAVNSTDAAARAEAAGPAELDDLMAAVRPLTTTEWRSYLDGRPARPELLEATRIQDLPAGT